MSNLIAGLALAPILVLSGPTDAGAQSAVLSPQQAFVAGCGGCHSKESAVLAKIPRLADNQRRAWLLDFMISHPCEADRLKPQIADYLMARTAR